MNSPDCHMDVLLVDDEPLIRDFGSKALRLCGFSVLVACDAAEALRISGSEAKFDLLVTDVQMGDGLMDGFELASLIMSEHPGIPVVLMSGYAEFDRLAATRGLAFLSKPFDVTTLIDCIRTAASKTPSQSEVNQIKLGER